MELDRDNPDKPDDLVGDTNRRHIVGQLSVSAILFFTFLRYNMRRNLSRRFVFPITGTLKTSEVFPHAFRLELGPLLIDVA